MQCNLFLSIDCFAIYSYNFSFQRPVLETSIFIPDEWVFIFMLLECCCLIIILFQIWGRHIYK